MENWGRLSHLFAAVFLSNMASYAVNPAITDVIVEAVCGGKQECSLAIYLTGVQQAVTGLGAVVMMPVIGNLSDIYGRKKLMLIPLILSVFPSAILAWQRTENYVYVYFAFKILTAMVTEGGVICLALAYLADNVREEKRVSAFGILFGVVSAANLCGTLAARILSTPHIFQVAAGVSSLAVIYVSLMLKESHAKSIGCSLRGDVYDDLLQQTILRAESDENRANNLELNKKLNFVTGIPSPKDIIGLLTSSVTISLLTFVAFFNSLADVGVQSFLLYFLKARFNFMKDQFADVLLITYVGATFSSMFFLPALGPLIGEEILLILGLFAGFVNIFLDSIAWSAWVPYASASLGFFLSWAAPNLRSLVSKQSGPHEQGIAQGCILGITSLGSLLSPIVYSPLSALFLAEDAPFHFPGFSIFCVGLAYLIGSILSVFIKIHIGRRSRV
ncbi:Major facilitator superfamily protein [Striga hermonthica]|uniref:Major facilitator superfamily protein n=1 Tax=Striga hermonthica TaxID=68872 RepID=A0A9N7MEB5_STRHE|nr:Major facilitator superfamily protein [Striga hermonthica]